MQILLTKFRYRAEELLPAQSLYEMKGTLINIKLTYDVDAILKSKMAAKIGRIQLGIHL